MCTATRGRAAHSLPAGSVHVSKYGASVPAINVLVSRSMLMARMAHACCAILLGFIDASTALDENTFVSAAAEAANGAARELPAAAPAAPSKPAPNSKAQMEPSSEAVSRLEGDHGTNARSYTALRCDWMLQMGTAVDRRSNSDSEPLLEPTASRFGRVGCMQLLVMLTALGSTITAEGEELDDADSRRSHEVM